MIDLFYRGEPFFMSVLLASLVYILVWAMLPEKAQRKRQHLWFSGLFAFVFGIFSQFLGMYGALQAISDWGGTTAEIYWQGLATSFVPAVFGLAICTLAWLVRWRIPLVKT